MPTEGQMRRVQWEGLIAGILLLPVFLGVLYLINSTVEQISLLFIMTDLFFVGFLVGDVFVIVHAARELGLIGTRE
jgi:uncharacterized integral membrane protein